jgi:hypothetical protein
MLVEVLQNTLNPQRHIRQDAEAYIEKSVSSNGLFPLSLSLSLSLFLSLPLSSLLLLSSWLTPFSRIHYSALRFLFSTRESDTSQTG